MKILIVNEGANGNLGDQAIHEGLLALLDGAEIDRISLGVERRNGAPTDAEGKRKILTLIKSNRLLYGALNFFRILAYNVRRYSGVKSKIKQSDKVIIGGGSLLINNSWSFPISLLMICMICLFTRTTYGFCGISTRRERSLFVNAIFKFCLKRARFIYFRDHVSIKVVEEKYGLDARFIPDFALVQSGSRINSTFSSQRNRPAFLVNVMGPQPHGYFSDSIAYSEYISYLTELISELAARRLLKGVVVTGGQSDIDIVANLLAKIRHIKVDVFTPLSVKELRSLYSSVDCVIGTRLHSAIIALGNNISSRCFNWDKKVEGFFSEIGRADLLFDCTTKVENLITVPMGVELDLKEYFDHLREVVLNE
ncbi:polysaccharide pyruvyl transferase family protein [Marinobacter halophilus]|uniref:Polysaccharide pyruvyl transferase domain-containing protein n=1 Tax=Marinobacter halophilus TaxID=1323740 RepID=A0A2T1KDZ5_9GAMM|nr:polysaccharide pyruvyl transferase family protein [Marinobacter halophilus]PSF07762.1 hypothetical protein C7H08_10125 [Marinobacter halophilus]GGC56861.1 hypothetical protein GCM10011362_01520 [Marinobacter halophilus]